MTSESALPATRWLRLQRAGGVVTVQLHRPERRNALDAEVLAELTAVAEALRRMSDVHAVVLSGSSDIFSAGMDLKAARALLGGASGDAAAARPTLMQQRERLRAGPEMTDAWERIEAVTIAAIEGPCLGGGAALALACDWRIVGAGATFRLPEVPLGMNMSWHSLPRLAALVGPARAKRITILGEAVDARTMLDWGLAEAAVGAGEALAEARRWAEQVAELPPLPVRMTKEALNAAVAAQHHALAFADRDQYLLAAQSEDLREGVAAFFEKRKPRFRGA